MDEATLDVIHQWMAKGDHDLRTARITLANDPELTDTVCYHCQQCAEKCLKAFHVYLGLRVEKIHELTDLLDSCCKFNVTFETLRPAANVLTDYAYETRYPDDWREISMAEAAEAIEAASRVKEFVAAKMLEI